MNSISTDDLVIKESDLQRLERVIALSGKDVAERLEEEISRAEIVADSMFPADAVCLGSEVTFVNVGNGKESRITVVLPSEADLGAGKISILSSMGSALIGLRTGGSIDWQLPDGKPANIQVVAISQAGQAVEGAC
jgi:regulator of nucleoside diphosphate kinase